MLNFILKKSPYENQCPSLDSSENPLCFFFKNIKIVTNSWTQLQKTTPLLKLQEE